MFVFVNIPSVDVEIVKIILFPTSINMVDGSSAPNFLTYLLSLDHVVKVTNVEGSINLIGIFCV